MRPEASRDVLLMHRGIVGTRAFAGVLAAYAVAAVPLALAGAGMVLAVEMSYRLATQPELGTRMRLLWTQVDAASPWPWIAAGVALAGGGLLLRIAWRRVAAAWERATAEATRA